MKKSLFIPQLKIADMFSMAGLALVGVGIGTYFHESLAGVISSFLLIGLVFHGLGMYGKYQIEHQNFDPPAWVVGSFVLATMGLFACGLYILIAQYTRFIVN